MLKVSQADFAVACLSLAMNLAALCDMWKSK